MFNLYDQTQNGWTKTPEGTNQVLSLCIDLCESSLKAYDEIEGSGNNATASQLSSARLTTQVTARIYSTAWSTNSEEIRIGNNYYLHLIINFSPHFPCRDVSRQPKNLSGRTNAANKLRH